MTCSSYVYYPTTTVFVDDNNNFLNVLRQRFSSDFPAIFSNDPIASLNKILQDAAGIWSLENIKNRSQIIYESYEEHENHDGLEHQSRWDIFKGAIYDSRRFSKGTVLVVDQMMPGMDGITLCRKLKTHPIKKIMLTANADLEIAVDAFNEKLIDHFILKDSPSLVRDLAEKISQLQAAYFNAQIERLSGFVNNSMIQFQPDSPFYTKIINQVGATERYLLDEWGSTLFLTPDGTPVTLVVRPASVQEFFAKIADDHDEHAIATDLRSGTKILYFQDVKDTLRSPSDWGLYLVPATSITEKNDLFYSVLNGVCHQSISTSQLKSYTSYLSLKNI